LGIGGAFSSFVMSGFFSLVTLLAQQHWVFLTLLMLPLLVTSIRGQYFGLYGIWKSQRIQ
jgi:hypothetical protein